MVENFRFEQIAEEASKILAKEKDEMTAFGMSEGFIAFGTFNGCVHVLYLETNQGLLLGPFSPIKDLACLGDSLAYVSGKQIVLYNAKSQQETFSTSLQGACKVSISSSLLGNTALICATSENLYVLQKGWVATNVKQTKIVSQGIYELVAHGQIVCLMDIHKFQAVNLLDEEVLYETLVPRGVGKVHWMSAVTLLVFTGTCIEVLTYSQENSKNFLRVTDRIPVNFIVTSIASFNQSNIVVLSSDLKILNSQKEIFSVGAPPVNGKLLSCRKSNSPFYLIGNNQIFKVELPNVKEKIKGLVLEFKFEKAYELSERFKVDVSEVLYPHIEHLLRMSKFEEASETLSKRLTATDKNMTKIIEKFLQLGKVDLIIQRIPFIEDESINSQILTQLASQKEVLKEYLNKWPLVMLTKPSMIATLKKLGFYDILIENFIKLGKTTEALKIALDVNSRKCFEIMERFPETFSLFQEIPDFLSVLFGLDCVLAGSLCESNGMEIRKVLEWLPPELIIEFLSTYPKLDLELEKMLFEEILKNCPEKLISFVSNSKFVELEYILKSIQSTNLDLLKVFVLKKLGKTEDLMKILKNNFEVRLNYISNYPDLWPETLSEAKHSVEKTRKVLEFLHLYSDSLSFVSALEFKDYEPEVKRFIKKQGKIVDIFKNAVAAAKTEGFEYFKLLKQELSRGILFDAPFVCCRCAQPINSARLRKCGHHSHKDCFDKCLFCVDPAVLTKP